MNKLLTTVAALALLCDPAQANFTFPNASSASVTAFSFDGSTTPAGTSNCASTTECTASVPINTAGSPLWLADNAAWTAGTTPQSLIGCEFTSGGATAITTGHAGTPGC